MQSKISSDIPELTPYDVQVYVDSTDKDDLPVVPVKYQLSQICTIKSTSIKAMSFFIFASLNTNLSNMYSFAL